MKAILLFLVFVLVTIVVGQSTNCAGNELNSALRTQIVDRHNYYRTLLATGQSTIKGGAKASPAKNMYKLKYSCELETIAQNWANKCNFSHSPSNLRNAGENLFMMGIAGYDKSLSLKNAADLWWNELEKYGGITPTNVVLTIQNFNLGIGHWSQMAWGKTTTIGCGYKSCPTQRMSIVVCNYRTTGNYLNQNIYEIGKPCTSNGQCTTYPNSKCDLTTKLCSV
uniref:SCP domain-containing protein n=1 Tax=Panagrolaimus sp. JU765 TaxID=591449 RepID=A0AC34Q3M8_9BILA